jgi:hypothetical protein
MEVIVFVFVIGCFCLLMWHRGAFSADRQPAVVDPHAAPLDRWEERAPPELPADYCPERDGWPPPGSPHWRLGGRGGHGSGGSGTIFVGGDGGGGGSGGGDGGGGGGGC